MKLWKCGFGVSGVARVAGGKIVACASTPAQPEMPPQAREPTTLLAEWHRHHGSDWLRADELHPAVRRMIDAQDRTAAIRQKLRQQVGAEFSGLRLETRRSGSAALYRVT